MRNWKKGSVIAKSTIALALCYVASTPVNELYQYRHAPCSLTIVFTLLLFRMCFCVQTNFPEFRSNEISDHLANPEISSLVLLR